MTRYFISKPRLQGGLGELLQLKDLGEVNVVVCIFCDTGKRQLHIRTLEMKSGMEVRQPITGASVFYFFYSCSGGLRPKAAADRSHMLPRCLALQRCQASLKEWSASLLCYPTIMCLTFPWQRCHSTSPPSFQLEGPCTPTTAPNKTFCSISLISSRWRWAERGVASCAIPSK